MRPDLGDAFSLVIEQILTGYYPIQVDRSSGHAI